MSSPLRSLDNKKKLNGKRSMPFRSMDFSAEQDLVDKLLNDNAKKVSTSRQEKKSSLKNDKISPTSQFAPTDSDLRMSMMKRIAQLEKQVLVYSKEVIDKDRRIKVLEEKVDLYKRHHNGESSKQAEEIEDLKRKCENYENQIEEMEQFLSDYGLVWVGEDSLEKDEILGGDYDGEVDPNKEKHFIIDFDLIIRNIRELNELAGEGEHKIQKTVEGATLKIQESIPLTLYANGILMFDGPFRDFGEATTQRYLADIADGFFPSELQERYPDGVPIQVTDCRHTTYKDPRFKSRFPGVGRTLGRSSSAVLRAQRALNVEGEYKNTKLSNIRTLADASTSLPKSADDFLNKLPSSVIKGGKIINIRKDIEELLGRSNGDSSKIKEMFTNVSDGNDAATDSTNNSNLLEDDPDEKVTTIRVRSEDGNSIFTFKLQYNKTIGDLRKAIDKKRPSHTSPYDVTTNFPKKRFNDANKSLQDCGLVPNATIILTPSHLT